MKKTMVAISTFVVAVLTASFFVPSSPAFANGVSSGSGTPVSGSGAGSGCVYDYDTCYGATWRWYGWPDGQSSVTVSGGGKDYTQGFTISGTDAQNCAQAGGYFRYGLVSKSSGSQVGSLPIGGNASSFWNSTYLGGSVHYRGSDEGEIDWGTVESAYRNAAAQYGYTEPWETRMWFCASYDGGGGGGPNPTPTPVGASCDDWTPASYNSNQTSVITKVKNASNGSGYSDMAWVGVGQTAQWIHCYYPGVQKLANTTVTINNRRPGTWTCSSMMKPDGHTMDTTIYHLKNGALSASTTWQNFFNINRSSANGTFSGSVAGGSYAAGVANIQSKTDSYGVGGGNVADTLRENATTGTPTTASTNNEGRLYWSCPYDVYDWEYGVTGYGCARTIVISCPKQKCTQTCTANCTNPCQYGCCGYAYGTNCTTSCTTVTGTCERTVYDGPCYGMVWGWHSGHSANCNNQEDFISWSTNNPNTASSNNAEAKVPVNYSISGEISINSEVVYSGETANTSDGKVKNNAKWNGATRNAYATDAYNVKYKLISYASDRDESGESVGSNVCASHAGRCDSSEEKLAGRVGAYGSVNISGSGFGSVNVPDIEAGKYFCVVLSVYPSDSGSDTNMGNWNGSGQWRAGVASCKIVAKKPSAQVWGTGLYSAGAVKIPESYKTNLASVSGREYSQTGTSKMTVFGSWVEQAVYSVGLVQGLASGAATSGGSFEGNNYRTGYCNYRTPLSFANYSLLAAAQICTNVQKTGGMATSASVVSRGDLLQNLVNGNTNKISLTTDDVDINNSDAYIFAQTENGKDVRYTYKSGGFNLVGATVDRGVVHVVRSDADIKITGNIEYAGGNYDSLEQVPKMVIYAKNITIDCAVKRIDAVLLVENNINTCDSEDSNSENNSNQLKINGTVITNTLTLNRTYGAATGINSGVPAEIINYDTSLILWASMEVDLSNTDTMNITYQSELAPRY